jgi:hypothetical protein
MVYDQHHTVSWLREETKRYETLGPRLYTLDMSSTNRDFADLLGAAHTLLTTECEQDVHDTHRATVCNVTLRYMLYCYPLELVTSFTTIDDPEVLATLEEIDSPSGDLTRYVRINTNGTAIEDALGRLSRRQYDCILKSDPESYVSATSRDRLLRKLLERHSDDQSPASELAGLLIAGHDGAFEELVELAGLLTRVP